MKELHKHFPRSINDATRGEKDPFKAEDKLTNLMPQNRERSLIGFRFHVTTNL